MAEATYSVVFDGHIAEGENQKAVMDRLSKLLKVPPERIAVLFSGRTVLIKRDVSKAVAERYRKAFLKAGAVCRLRTGREVPRPTRPLPEPPAKTAAPEPPKLTVDNLAGHFQGVVDPVPVTMGYRVGLVGVAALMLLLPLAYLGLCASVGYFTYWWATHAKEILPLWSKLLLLAMYVIPLVTGVILFVFMLKPLFAKSAKHRLPVILKGSEEPLFFAFVHRICDMVGAPRPKFIQVDCQVNASAGFFMGRAGPGRRDLVLTIGMPVIAGMTTRQLAGVLAHEFGHFAQGAGMLTTYMVRSISYWFHTSVYRRDEWDVRLEQYARETESMWIGFTIYIALGAIWIARQLMALVMMLGDLASHFMLRHMEFDADRYEAQMAGSAQFKDTAVRLRLLTYAYNAAYADLDRLWENRKLVDDIPTMVVEKAAELQEEFDLHVGTMLEEEQTEIFDTHPADAERIAAAEKVGAPGVFKLELPSPILLANYDDLVKQTTRRFYISDVGIKPTEEQLLSIDERRQSVDNARKEDDALLLYFRDLFLARRFIKPVAPGAFEQMSPEDRKSKLEELVGTLRHAGPEISDLVHRYAGLYEDLAPAFALHVYMTDHLEPEYAPQLAPDKLDYANLREKMGKVEAALSKHESVQGKRLAIALGGLLSATEAPERRWEIDAMLAVQKGFAGIQENYDALYRELALMVHLIQVASATQDAETGESAIPPETFETQMASLHERRMRITASLQKLAYPFDRGGGRVDVFSHLSEELPPVPEPEFIGQMLHYLGSLHEIIVRLHVRVMSRLAFLAGEFEAGLGVAPIKIQLKPSD